MTITNAFSDKPIRTESIYSAIDAELINGCYYRQLLFTSVEYEKRKAIPRGAN